MTTIRLILCDQLSHNISSLKGIAKNDFVLMFELMQELTYVKHHPKKIAFTLSSMRHFANELVKNKHKVRYIELEDPANSGAFVTELQRAIKETSAKRLVVTEPSEYRFLELLQSMAIESDIEIEIRHDDRFLCSIPDFKLWAQQHKQLRMEYFYREMRRRYKILLEQDGKPTGGEWNYDKQNRKPPTKGLIFPKRISHQKDSITKAVLELVHRKFSQHFGRLEPFHFAVNREQALIELDHFIAEVLPDFGTYQDAMIAGEPFLYHSLISSYLNIGLLLPLEICQKAEQAYRTGKAPLNSVEGFIRQILGWREFIRGIYWLHMPKYAAMNFLDSKQPLPEFYWTAETKMFCIAEAVRHTRDYAYSHHIQRLMVTGNFALLAGIDVAQVQEWYLAVYSDAYEWVEMPNTLGMALFGDGGIVGSKPYAASGKYINKMSNFCSKCQFDPNETIGDNACPFNALYWDFFARNKNKLKNNARVPFVYTTWEKFGEQKQKSIREKAVQILLDMQEAKL
jgi:deoxyribodipyrimidine photolyase-related protein